jgi:hypothetical protein
LFTHHWSAHHCLDHNPERLAVHFPTSQLPNFPARLRHLARAAAEVDPLRAKQPDDLRWQEKKLTTERRLGPECERRSLPPDSDESMRRELTTTVDWRAYC